MNACSITVRGVVQGVGFRPFVFRLAHEKTLAGWVLNNNQGVEIFLEGPELNLEAFVQDLKICHPPAAQIAEIEVRSSEPEGLLGFEIRDSVKQAQPNTRISPDLPVCEKCLAELFDPQDRRFHYPYINCTYCGPRFSVVQRLPYDRQNTTMSSWPLDGFCAEEYHDSANRRFHAQPVACPECGPNYRLVQTGEVIATSEDAISKAADLLRNGKILAVKGLGGYHLACDAKNDATVLALRQRKYRKEKPFALMVRNLQIAQGIAELSPDAKLLVESTPRPIVIAQRKIELPEVAPGSHELGVMLPYTPVHYLLFDAGAPEIMVMTSANRSSEPIAYNDTDAMARLAGIADAFLIGERPIARRVDDSVARAGIFGPAILRRSRGYAPGAACAIPANEPILAVGADLKNTITLVVDGQAFVSQHIGDLHDYQSLRSFEQTIDDFVSMYELLWSELLVVHDVHPQYVSTLFAKRLSAARCIPVQHHRAHIASVLAERQEWERRVVGVSFDGTGYGDDGAIWGGEIFLGNLATGLERIGHLRPAVLPGGDAAAQCPVQAAAGFLAQIGELPDLTAAPFFFPKRFNEAQRLMNKNVRTFSTTSMGRLFDTAAALLGFTREISFEGQAAMWLEQLARDSRNAQAFSFPFEDATLDFRPLLSGVASARQKGRNIADIARAFQRGIAWGLAHAIEESAKKYDVDTVVLSGGVFQNELLMEDLHDVLQTTPLNIWINHVVPANDGGISLGQAAIGAFARTDLANTGLRNA
jgi:hydrogenase maturation protein HypF